MKKLRRPIIAANWKMNGSYQMIKHFCTQLHSYAQTDLSQKQHPPECILCLPFPYLSFVQQKGILAIGAQDLSSHAIGAYTGEVSAKMLTDVAADWVIIGHSERRQYHNESETVIQAKIQQALSSSLKIILCIGETLQQKDQGLLKTTLRQQLTPFFQTVTEKNKHQFVIAYEPVWAIGSGLTPTTVDIQNTHNFIRKEVVLFNENLAKELRILYGGSVKPTNSKEIFSLSDVDGGLIGGASLKADDFIKLIESV